MPTKLQIYRHIIFFLILLLSFVFFQLFILYPRKIIYSLVSFNDKTLTINVENTNNRDLRIKWTITNKNRKIVRKSIIKRKRSVLLEIDGLKGNVEIMDNYGSLERYIV